MTSPEARFRVEVGAFRRFLQEARKTFGQFAKTPQKEQRPQGVDMHRVQLPGNTRALLAEDFLAPLREIPPRLPTSLHVGADARIEVGQTNRVRVPTLLRQRHRPMN